MCNALKPVCIPYIVTYEHKAFKGHSTYQINDEYISYLLLLSVLQYIEIGKINGTENYKS